MDRAALLHPSRRRLGWPHHDLHLLREAAVSEQWWDEVRFVFPPSEHGHGRQLIEWAHANGFKVVDWCIWERKDGARLTIDPVPEPAPHGFPSPFDPDL